MKMYELRRTSCIIFHWVVMPKRAFSIWNSYIPVISVVNYKQYLATLTSTPLTLGLIQDIFRKDREEFHIRTSVRWKWPNKPNNEYGTRHMHRSALMIATCAPHRVITGRADRLTGGKGPNNINSSMCDQCTSTVIKSSLEIDAGVIQLLIYNGNGWKGTSPACHSVDWPLYSHEGKQWCDKLAGSLQYPYKTHPHKTILTS